MFKINSVTLVRLRQLDLLTHHSKPVENITAPTPPTNKEGKLKTTAFEDNLQTKTTTKDNLKKKTTEKKVPMLKHPTLEDNPTPKRRKKPVVKEDRNQKKLLRCSNPK